MAPNLDPPADIADSIVKYVSGEPEQRVNATVLGQWMRSRFQGFAFASYQCLNLRDFIRKHVKELIEVAVDGPNIIYGIKGAEPVASPAIIPSRAANDQMPWVDTKVWQTFSSPSELYKLFCNQETGAFKVIPSEESDPSLPWVRIPSLTNDFHQQIGREFVETLQDEVQRSVLSQTFEQPRWWLAFLDTARTIGVDSRWNDFRKKKIAQELKAALQRVGITNNAAAIPPARPPVRGAWQPPVSTFRPRGDSSRPFQNSSPLLRRLASFAIQNMSTAELRQIPIPLGYILDALDDK